MFGVGMACAALRDVLADLERVQWLPEHAGINLAGEGRVVCILPGDPESNVAGAYICLSIHNDRWFPVTVTVESDAGRRAFLFKYSCLDGSILSVEPFEPTNEFEKFDFGQSMICPHPVPACQD